MPAIISHIIMAGRNTGVTKPPRRKITPQREIIPPIFLQSDLILILAFSSEGIFFHAVRWMCPLPKANHMPANIKAIPKKIQVKFKFLISLSFVTHILL